MSMASTYTYIYMFAEYMYCVLPPALATLLACPHDAQHGPIGEWAASFYVASLAASRAWPLCPNRPRLDAHRLDAHRLDAQPATPRHRDAQPATLCPTAMLTTAPLHHCTTALLHCCTAALLLACTPALL